MPVEVARKLRELSVGAVLRKARDVIGVVPQPMDQRCAPLTSLSAHAISPEVDLEESLDANPFLLSGPVSASDIHVSFQEPRVRTLVLVVDTSLSMTGPKLALTAVALAVVLLQFPQYRIGIVAFENVPTVIQDPAQAFSLKEVIERFLDVPGEGYTDLEAALKSALVFGSGGGPGRSATLLLTDGKYTAGRDPCYLAPQFHTLSIVKMGHDRASNDFCERLAVAGRGEIRRLAEIEELPPMMYSLVKALFRG